MNRADDIVVRARALIGTRFRPQGRGADGLDCVGLVAASLGISGVRGDYALRGGCPAMLAREIERAGLRRVAEAEAGDVLAVRAGPGQLHLGIWSGSGLIHADAGLRRVAERPAPLPWPVLACWRA